MYGPPPDPSQHLVEAPLGAWVGSILLGLTAFFLGVYLLRAGSGWRPRVGLGLLTLGATAGLTAPMFGMIPVAILGSFPTIDKAGSLHFYREGVHWHLLDPTNPGVQLIGVHLGHLWVVQAFALLLPDWAGFNAESFLNLWLAWWCTGAWLLGRIRAKNGLSTGSLAVAVLLGIPFALNLHQFRDINWYTVEKTAIFVLPLWLSCVAGGRAWACAGVGALAMFLNVYMGILIAAMGAWMAFVAVVSGRRVELTPRIQLIAATALGMLPFVVWQGVLMRGAHAPGSPEQFLTERACLDVVSVVPWTWNRLEGWRAMNPCVLALAGVWVYGELIWRRSLLTIAGCAVAIVVALGPAHNPVYMALFDLVPGFWRVAKPETFFYVPWLLMVTGAAEVLGSFLLSRRALIAFAAIWLTGWAWGVRAHPVYPEFYSQPPAAR